jgi:hypothetical protein
MHVVASLNTPGFQKLAEFTWHQNKIEYCRKHGYAACNKTQGFHEGIPIGFEKILYLQVLMENPQYEWIWWTGCDTLITNFNIRIEDRIDENFNLIISNDQNNLNADSFLIKNCDWSRAYIQCVLDCMPQYLDNIWKEQGVMIDLYPSNKDYIKIVPQKLMQSWPLAPQDALGNPGQWTSGDWLIHWAGHTMETRLRLATLYQSVVIK